MIIINTTGGILGSWGGHHINIVEFVRPNRRNGASIEGHWGSDREGKD